MVKYNYHLICSGLNVEISPVIFVECRCSVLHSSDIRG